MTEMMALRKLLVRTAFLGLLVFSAFASAQADSSIIPLQVAPDVIFANAPTQVIVTAAISTDSPLLKNSVIVVRLDANGHGAMLGRLYDDGTHGDELAGDNVYSGQVSLKEIKVGDIRFVVSAAYRGGLKRLTSPAFVITVTNRPSLDELNMTLQTEQNAGQSFARLRKQMGDELARAAVVSDLRKQPNVAAAGISSDGHTIWIRYANGLEADILAGPVGTMGGLATQFNSSFNNIYQELFVPLNFQKGVSCSCGQQTEPKVKPIVLAPFFDQFSPYDASDDVARSLERTCLDAGYSGKVRPLKNSAVTLGTMKTLYQFNVVYVNTHGAIDSNDQVEIATREQATVISKLWNWADWWKGRITPVTADGQTFYWAINPKFVDYYAKGRFKNALVYLSACDTFGAGKLNLTLVNAFLNNGAVSSFGWMETVHTDFASSTSSALFNTLTDPKLSSSSRSTGRAFDAITPKTEPTPPNATFTMAGSRNLVLSVPSSDQCPRVVVSTSLQFSPNKGPYSVGQTISSTFSVTNRGSAKIEISKVLTSGRIGTTCPNNVCPDFTTKSNITLAPGQTYNYSGTITPSATGHYTFSVAYQNKDGSWIIPVDTEKGTINKLGIVVQNPPPKLTGKSPASISASPNAQTVYLHGTGLNRILYCYVQFPNGRGTYIYIPLAQVTGRSNEQLETKIKFATRGTYYIWAYTMDGGRSNALPIVVN